jgi:hypothetical protein
VAQLQRARRQRFEHVEQHCLGMGAWLDVVVGVGPREVDAGARWFTVLART